MPDKSAEKARFARVVDRLIPGLPAPHWGVWLDNDCLREFTFRRDAEDFADKINAAHEKAVQEALLDVMTVELFEKAPCYVCGYNSEGYYQPDIHPCAKKYHAIRALRGNG